MLGLHKDKIILLPYDETWAECYQKEAERLQNIMGNYIVQIEHVGSTAIPNIISKSIIDIAVAVQDFDSLIFAFQQMRKYGYDVKENIADKGEFIATKGLPENRTHCIFVTTIDSKRWKELIFFRDYLLNHPTTANKYSDLKQSLLEQFPDSRAEYENGKNEFVSDILRKI